MFSSGLNLCIGWDLIQIHYLFKYYLKKIGGQHANCEYISPFGGKVVEGCSDKLKQHYSLSF